MNLERRHIVERSLYAVESVAERAQPLIAAGT
jgi:hypothetical protein